MGDWNLSNSRWPLAGLAVFLGLSGLAAASDTAADAPPVYIGSASCGGCHVEQRAAWQGSHHDLAMQPATEETVLGDFNDRAFEHRGVSTRFYRDGGRFLFETLGIDGDRQTYEIAYTFGVTPLQQYLVGFPDGRYQALTTAWDTRPAEAGGQRWFHLYPNEDTPPGDELHWLAPAHNWNFACAECHSTNLRKGYDAVKDRYATTWTDIDVGCEACHGPGSRHVQLAEAATAGDRAGYPEDHGLVVRLSGAGIWTLGEGNTAVRSSAIPPVAEVELCGRCHARRTQLSEDYRHGAPLSDSHRVSLLEEGLYYPDGQILDEVYVYGSFVQSRMHAAGVTCSDCHESHSLKLRRPGNSLCTDCHRPSVYDAVEHHHHQKDGEGAACIACHMPQRTYMVVDPRRDHSFRVPRPDLSERFGVPNVCTGCHRDREPSWAENQIAAWYGEKRHGGSQTFAPALAAARGGEPGAGKHLTALAGDPAAPAIARATALSALGNYLAPSTLESVVGALRAADPLERGSAAETLLPLDVAARWQLLSPLLDDAVRGVRVAVAGALADVPLEELSETDRARLQRGFDEYLASERLNADRAEHWVNLAGFHARQGAIAEAELAYKEALRRNPRYLPAFVNHADLLRTLGRETEAEAVLRGGISVLSRGASLHHALGLLLVRTQRMDQAIQELRAAWELDPQSPRFGYVYGVALDSTGKPEEALKVWKSVVAGRPNDLESLQALALGLYQRGRPDEALTYAVHLEELNPDDPSIQRLGAAIRAAQGR